MVPFEADQVTAVFEVLLTVAENCCVLPEPTCAELGETDTTMAETGGSRGVTVSDVLADLVESAMLVARTTTWVSAVTFGAANMPPDEILPFDAHQATAVFAVLLTVAVNCCFPPEGRIPPSGETATLIGGSELPDPSATYNEMVASPRF